MSNEKKGIGEALKSLGNRIADKLDDLATLEVTTYTSNAFTVSISDFKQESGDKFKIKSLMDTAPATLNANLDLLAYSRFEVDADVSSIVRQKLTEQDQVLLDAHNSMVESAQNARKAMFDFAKDLLKSNLS